MKRSPCRMINILSMQLSRTIFAKIPFFCIVQIHMQTDVYNVHIMYLKSWHLREIRHLLSNNGDNSEFYLSELREKAKEKIFSSENETEFKIN